MGFLSAALLALVAAPCPQGTAQHELDAFLVELVEKPGPADDAAVERLAARMARVSGPHVDKLLHAVAAGEPGAEACYGRTVVASQVGRAALVRALALRSDEELAAAAVAFANLPHPRTTTASERPGQPHGTTALLAVGRIPGPAGLRAAVGIGNAAAPDGRCPFSLALEEDLARRLRADDGLLREATRLGTDAAPAVARSLLAAIGGSGSPRAVGTLLQWLQASEAPRDVLLALTGLVGRADAAQRAVLAARIEGLAGDDDPITAQVAATLLGECGNPAFVETLVRALEHDHAGVRRAARRSLAELTGQNFPAEPRPWRLWIDRERVWYRERAPGLLDRLTGTGDAACVPLRELSHHRLFARELGPSLVAALDHPSDAVCAAACSALGTLGASEGLDELVGLLDDDSPEVRGAALSSLRALTGLDLSDDSRAWVRALAGRL